MTESNETGRAVLCEGCGCAFEPEMESDQMDAIERLFYHCPFCGKVYLAAVTDEALRKSIREYTALAEANKKERLPESEQFRMQRMKEENVQRSRELMQLYPFFQPDTGEVQGGE